MKEFKEWLVSFVLAVVVILGIPLCLVSMFLFPEVTVIITLLILLWIITTGIKDAIY